MRNVPALTGPVVDEASLLTPAESSEISRMIQSWQQSGQVQFQVLTVKGLDDEPIEAFSIRVVDQWKLGNEARDNGVLLLIAPNEKKVRIEVGQGLEGDLTDAFSSRVIREILGPQFKKGNFAQGIAQGLLVMAKKAGVQPSGGTQGSFGKRQSESIPWGYLLFGLLYFAVLPFSRKARRMGGFGSSGHWPRGGGFGGGGFGGGGWGGGGGGFSGGGASGSW